ncbi:MAG: patatin-like phospholipase family protein [Myxococcaceae bacterium]|nr:patatin-like phospholipase family protein [Myxococcaceae bacterium]
MTSLGARLSGKRFGLVLSAGYFGFYGHAGFVDALLRHGLAPTAFAGTSAGGMVAAFTAAGLPMRDLKALITSQRREHFWDPDWVGIAIDSVRRGHRPSGLLKGARFRALLERHLPVPQFEQTKQPLVLVATSLSSQRAVTLTSGELASAIHATCAYPGLFQAVRRDGDLLWDGGIVDKAPAVALLDAKVAPLDALLVHYLPSRGGSAQPGGPFAYASGMSSGFAAVRREHFKLQLEVLHHRGVPTYVVTSHLPPVSPRSMASGAKAIEAGAESITRALAAPPVPWEGAD